MESSRRKFVQGTAAGLLLGGLPQARSQGLEAAKVVIGFAPGGTIDVTGRRVADKLAPVFAKTAIAENRTGAGGQIAVQAVKAAAPDGATILLTPASPLGLHPFTYRKLPYDPLADLVPVSGAASFDYALAVGPLVPAAVRTVPEFLAWCKANPGQASFGSAGAGSAANFIGAALGKAGQADLRHVAYRGSQPAMLDLIGGQLAAVVGPTGEFMGQLKAGKVRLLATSGPRRGKFTPETPSYAEQGFKDLAYLGWFGFYLPARTPGEVVLRLNDAIRTALSSPDVVDSLAALYLEPYPTSPQQLAGLLKTETDFWAGLVRTVGYTPEG
ncbi:MULTISPECIES: Bug family tripartite tricarboxylate transporter substrate binding protein [Ramlibacter]|uniref:Twin-arginine translocation pathway signal protein n=1 Tax=Ramlibacter pinisoli TaxID=2682844 RepID=A0A6N8IM91_9BURK|nr:MULTISPECIES: Bug family tripartite tricarboxylate transporter substrate binding protein [Ramlibacter]MBA2960616.1 twin-arginine translocation pathway signal protein [Ramlibacter sp. CGMCC 1.13660]MVQ27947.1 twin-arginine translocation pathway signal protein [Ramlibacter pinisoli]